MKCYMIKNDGRFLKKSLESDMKSFTYKTVAEDAGVSEKTVARVIHCF